jgi:coproporphyrinogen III oxidase
LIGLDGRASEFFGTLQDEICAALEALDGEQIFREDRWSYQAGEGGGVTRIIADGAVFEKGGVNLSAVSGRLAERLAERLRVEQQDFFATGISLVLHPRSPMIPTAHMNMRYLQLGGGEAWFGGGADLTPYYLYEEDAAHFHRTFKQACDAHDETYYPRFKKWCDEYFHLKHRSEARGVGGIFFDYLKESLEEVFAFVQQAGKAFKNAYLPIVERRKSEPWNKEQRNWQLIRRGRYVEFNLIHDRGTLFGLETGGRTDSILISLPPKATWQYDHNPKPNSREAALLTVLKQPRDWA